MEIPVVSLFRIGMITVNDTQGKKLRKEKMDEGGADLSVRRRGLGLSQRRMLLSLQVG